MAQEGWYLGRRYDSCSRKRKCKLYYKADRSLKENRGRAIIDPLSFPYT
jgi:hypothetical protein